MKRAMETIMNYFMHIYMRQLFSRFFSAGLVPILTQCQFIGARLNPRGNHRHVIPLWTIKHSLAKAATTKRILMYFQFISNFRSFTAFKILFCQPHHKMKINTGPPAVC
jgi:hypothetical protein